MPTSLSSHSSRALSCFSICFALFTPLAAAGCSNDEPTGPSREHVTALRGRATDAAGNPLSGVRVSTDGAMATTRADGRYDLRVADGDHVVRFAKDGFVDVIARLDVIAGSPTQRDATMLTMAPAMMLDSTAGGSVAGMRGAALSAPASAFVAPSGAPVSGMVEVHLTAIDPSVAAELRGSSGDFTATPATGGSRVLLESFGMMDITVRQAGETLQVAPGSEIEIRIPVAAGTTTPEPTMALWSLDEETGIWTSEGVATYEPATRTYVARTRHMSVWNCDRPAEATCVCGRVDERDQGPLPGARIQASGVDYFGSSEATTDDMGRFCVAVRKDSEVAIAAYHASGGGESRRVRSGTADTDIPARMGDSRCLDVGIWTVERDVFRSDTGGTISCTDVSNPFSDACGSELWGIFECFQPVGACTIRSGGLAGSTITYANGARATTSISGTTVDIEYFAPSGALCATGHMTDVTAGGDVRMTFTSATTMRSFTMVIPESTGGDMVLECPGGARVVVTPEQRQAFEACSSSGSMSSGSGSMCTVEGGTPTPGTCTTDADCSAGTTCCAIPSAGNYCVSADVCAMVSM